MNEKKPKGKPGPPQERVKIEGDWGDAVGSALRKKKPKAGWPKSKDKKKQ